MVAASKGHMWGRNINDTIKLLLAHGANVEAVDNGEKGFKRAIHLACQYGGYEGATDIVEVRSERRCCFLVKFLSIFLLSVGLLRIFWF
jgi:hypothetical protein